MDALLDLPGLFGRAAADDDDVDVLARAFARLDDEVAALLPLRDDLVAVRRGVCPALGLCAWVAWGLRDAG